VNGNVLGVEHIHGLGAAAAGQNGPGPFVDHKPGRLNTGAAGLISGVIGKRLRFHGIGIHDQKIFTPAEPLIDLGIQIPACGTDGYFHASSLSVVMILQQLSYPAILSAIF
jgi:hypothetical protein